MASSSSQHNLSIVPLIQNRTTKYGFKNSEICRISNSLVPNTHKNLASYSGKLYCGVHSKDGRFFINATQGKNLYFIMRIALPQVLLIYILEYRI